MLLPTRNRASLLVEAIETVRSQDFVAYNDVDLCLKLGVGGLRNVFTPNARLRHHESASRGSDFSGARFAIWETERDAMREKWGEMLDDDPFFPPLLSFSAPARTSAEPPRRAGCCNSLAASSA